MMGLTSAVRPAVAAALAALMWTAAASAGARHEDVALVRQADATVSASLLDVPYLSQTEDLCGGAAVAMVLRYWGERQVYAEDFAPLVDRSVSGIRTDVLAADVVRRGWQSFPFSGDALTGATWVRQQIGRGRPILALIKVGPNRYHYVVIVAWTGALVIAHDPARGPFRMVPSDDFERVWAAAGRWALLVLPNEEGMTRPGPPTAAPTVPLPAPTSTCAPLVQEMVRQARAGAPEDAERGLLAASRLCPRDPAPWQELAGLRFIQSRWGEASAYAERATRLDPSAGHAWDLLATSRFLNDKPGSALDAWNRNGRPSVDLVRVVGAQRTRDPVVVALVALSPRAVLTADGYGRAARRLDELPSAVLTRLAYRPMEDGLAEVEAAVVEGPLVPRGVVPLGALAARAWIQRELRLDAAAPAGSGELWTVAWRWWENRPRIAFSLSVPVAPRLPGVMSIDGLWQTSSYEAPSAPQPGLIVRREERRRAAVTLADWASRRLRWRATTALDRWAQDSHLSLGAALDLRLADDHLSLGVESAAWMPLGSGGRFAQSGVSSVWRSDDRARLAIVAGSGRRHISQRGRTARPLAWRRHGTRAHAAVTRPSPAPTRGHRRPGLRSAAAARQCRVSAAAPLCVGDRAPARGIHRRGRCVATNRRTGSTRPRRRRHGRSVRASRHKRSLCERTSRAASATGGLSSRPGGRVRGQDASQRQAVCNEAQTHVTPCC